MGHLNGPTSTPSNSVVCLLTFAWRWTRITMTSNAETWQFGDSETSVMSDLIQNNRNTSQVRWKLKNDTWLIIKNINISNKFNFWSVHGIMNTSGLLQSYLLCKRPEVFMIPRTDQKSNSFLKCVLLSVFYAETNPVKLTMKFWGYHIRPRTTRLKLPL